MNARTNLKITLAALLLVSGASCSADVVGHQSIALTDVTWTNAVGVTVTGNDLTKTSGVGWNAGASSMETLTGDGFVQFTTPEIGRYKMIGLSNGDTDQSYADIDYAIYMMTRGRIRIYEGGTPRGNFGTYADGDTFRVEVVAGQVRYRHNGSVIYTSTVAPTFPLLVDSSFYTTGARVQNVAVDTSIWSNEVGVTAAANDLTKTDAGNNWDSGASSSASLGADGYVEFTTGERNTYKMAGLSNGDSGVAYADIDFAFYLMTNGRIRIYENGINRGSFGTYVAGDTFRVQASGGTVTYHHNGGLLYTSATSPTFPLLVDTSFYTSGATIEDVVITDSFWSGTTGVAVAGSSLTKTGTDGWDAGAASTGSIAADGYVEFTTGEINTYKMAGLSNGDTDLAYADIDFAFYLMTTGRIRVYENGVNRGSFGTYAAGDTFRIATTGGTVTYLHNGGLVYTSMGMPTAPLLVDTSLYSNGATVNGVTITNTP